MSYPTISNNPSVQAFYERMRGEGTSHSMAEMFALRKAPGIETDSTFFAGVGTLAEQFRGDDMAFDRIIKHARSKGYEPGPNDFYNTAIAKEEGDPLAFIPPTGGKSHIRKVCEKRGWAFNGCITVKGRDKAERQEIKTKRLKAKGLVQHG